MYRAFSASPAAYRTSMAHEIGREGLQPTPTPVQSRPHTATDIQVDIPSQYPHQQAAMSFQQQRMDRSYRLQERENLQREKSELSQQRAFRYRISLSEIGKQIILLFLNKFSRVQIPSSIFQNLTQILSIKYSNHFFFLFFFLIM